MNKFKDFFNRHGIKYHETGNEILIQCPFCNYGSVLGPMAGLNVNKETGSWWCGNKNCEGRVGDFPKLAEKLGFSWKGQETKDSSLLRDAREEKRGKFRLWSIHEVLEYQFEEQDWVINKLLPTQTITILSGNPQNFKTWVTIEIAKSIASGAAFLNQFQVTQGAVLIVNEEDHLRYLQKRFTLLGVTEEAPIYLLSQEGVKIDKDEWLMILLSLIREHSIKLVVFDSFIRIHSRRENDAVEMAYVLDRMRELTKEGVTVLITHHHRKSKYGPEDPSQSIRGSSDIVAAVDCHLSVERREDEIFVRQNKLRVDETLPPFRIIISRSEEGRFKALAYGGEFKEKELKKEKVKPVILDVLKEGEQDREELHTKVKSASGIGDNAIGEAFKELVGEGEVTVRIGKRNKKFYSLKNVNNEAS